MSATRSPRLGRAALGNSRWYLDQLVSFLITGEDTEGKYALLRFHGVHGVEPPPHIHSDEDETIHLLEGEVTFTIDGETIHAIPGDVVVIPRGAEHTFTSHDNEVKFLVLISPAGFENYFRELSVPAEFMGPCPNPLRADLGQLQATARKYGAVFTQSR